jgi:hypothetical protein
MDSILLSIKKLIGIEEDYDHFDQELVMNINTIFMTITQIGVGPETGFFITSADESWSDFSEDMNAIHGIKTYIALKTKLIFDPPSSSFVLESMQRQIAELEWRLNITCDKIEIVEELEDEL